MPFTPELERLRTLHAECERVTAEIEEYVTLARQKGASWQQIGDAIRMTKQGAQQKFGKNT